jgi:hypothetical protein
LSTGSFDFFEIRRQLIGFGGLALQAATLFKMHQMRRGVQTGFVARMAQHRLQHGAGGTLAIGASHGDDRARHSQLHGLSHFLNTLQTHVNGLRVQLLAMAKPVL